MTEPIYSDQTEQWWDRTPETYKREDEKLLWPMKAYVSSLGDLIGNVWDLYERFDYISPSDRQTPVVLQPANDDQVSQVSDVTVFPVGGSPVVWTLPTAPATLFVLARPADNEYVQWVGYCQGGTYQFTFDYQVLSPTTAGVASIYVNEQVVRTIDMRTGGTVGSVVTSLPYQFSVARGYVSFRIQFDTENQVDNSTARYITVGPFRLNNTMGAYKYSTSDLVDPLSADASWLPWLGQLYGVKVDTAQSANSQRQAILNGFTGFKAGTDAAIEALVATQLSGTKFVTLLPRTNGTGTIGAATMWDLTIVTRSSETPSGLDLAAFVVAQGAKPAGVQLHTRTFNATWQNLETLRPHWQDWEAVDWQMLEETGLT